jgi:hypothetical protein
MLNVWRMAGEAVIVCGVYIATMCWDEIHLTTEETTGVI